MATSNGISVPTSKIVWHSELQGTPEHILEEAEQTKNIKKLSAPEKAENFLREFLSKGPRTYPEISSAAIKSNLSEISITRAKKLANISSFKQKNAGSSSPFVWALPDSNIFIDSGTDASGDNLSKE